MHTRMVFCGMGSLVQMCCRRGTWDAKDSSLNDDFRAVSAVALTMLRVTSIMDCRTSSGGRYPN
eukprot:757542-Amphidinium_carterae.1